MLKNRPAVPFAQGGAYQKDNGEWYVTVTIDNSSTVERKALPEEIPVAEPAPKAPAPKKPEPMHLKKKGK
jgi:hypothetical protein